MYQCLKGENKTVKDLRMSETQLSKKFRDVFLDNLQKLYLEQETKIKAEKDEEIIKWPENLKDLEHDEDKFNKWTDFSSLIWDPFNNYFNLILLFFQKFYF